MENTIRCDAPLRQHFDLLSEPGLTGEDPMAIFAKYDGIDGESNDASHLGWLDIFAMDWGAHKPDTAIGSGRRRSAAIVEDFLLTMGYGKAAPKLQEMCLKGKVIPKLEVELTTTFAGTRKTYLKYELKNVAIRSFQTNAEGSDEAAPAVIVANSFEELKVVYTEFDASGSRLGDTESKYKLKS
ncbi:MAG: type VI secretion system tube protein Hcp [Gammaproteobacteria bacterium]|nr:type VI secretion system tube protein Hcp [Gammaproteobacteria bacterium]MCB1904675.1 type VI secretion system tube protein Hcp [Gammaproteobacteria bacterium]